MDLQTITQTILNIPVYELIIVLCLAYGFIVGLINGAIRKGIRIVISFSILAILYFTLVPFLSSWLEYYSFSTFNFVLTIPYEGITFSVYSVHDLFILLQNLNITTELLTNICSNSMNALSFIICMILGIVLSTPITHILYHLVTKRIILHKLKKEAGEDDGKIKYRPKGISRIFGGLLGLLQWFIILYMFTQPLGVLTSGLKEVLIPSLTEGNDLYNALIAKEIMDSSTILNIKSIIEIVNHSFNPQESYVFKYFISSNSGIWLYKGIDVNEDIEGNIITKEIDVQTTFSNFYSILIDRLKEVASS